MRPGKRKGKADTLESIPCRGMVVKIKKIFSKTEVIESIERIVVTSSFMKVLVASRIIETLSEDKETQSKHESEFIIKCGKHRRNTFGGWYKQRDRK